MRNHLRTGSKGLGWAVLGIVLFIIISLVALLWLRLPHQKQSKEEIIRQKTICARWYTDRQGLSPEQSAVIRTKYESCQQALLPASSPDPNRQTEKINIILGTNSTYFKRQAGDGVVIESSYAPLPSHLLIRNQWVAEVGDRRYMVFAGAQRSEPGGGRPLPEPLPGIIIVEVSQVEGELFPDEGGQYLIQEATGPVRIVDADGPSIYLVSDTGKPFAFDIVERQFQPVKENFVWSRASGDGEIIESQDAPYAIQGFQFENYWIKDGGQKLIVLAGQKTDEPKQGAVIVLVSAANDPRIIVEKAAYSVQPMADTLRVIQGDGTLLTLVTDEGLVLVFDYSKHELVSASHGEVPITMTDPNIQIIK